MAINLTRAWTAASLAPSIQPGTLTPLMPPTAGSNSLSNMLAAIYGPNYQNLLSTADRSGGGPLTPDMLNALANQTAATGYLTAQQGRHDVMTAFPRMAQIAQQRAFENVQATSRANPFGATNPSDIIAANNALLMQTQNLAQTQKVAQYAALSPTYAPQMQSSIGQQNTGASFNPYGLSGWISPAMTGGGLGYGGAGSPSSILMSRGV